MCIPARVSREGGNQSGYITLTSWGLETGEASKRLYSPCPLGFSKAEGNQNGTVTPAVLGFTAQGGIEMAP